MAERNLSDAELAGGACKSGRPDAVLVIILNFNGIADTLACLDSLQDQTGRPHAVLVIDNGSTADDLRPISARFPDVEVLALPENLGWAGGNNVGLRIAVERGFGAACLLNNDTVLDPGALEGLCAAADEFGPCLMHPLIAYFDQPARWQIGSSQAVAWLGPDFFELDFAYGACLLLPAEVLRRIGLFDERFFLQLEETDYFHRARLVGIRSLCTERARILHKESVSFGGQITPDKTYYQVRNQLLLTEKHMRNPRGILSAVRRLGWMLHNQSQARGDGVRGVMSLLRWLISGHPLASAARHGATDYLRRRFGRRASRGRAA